MNEKFDIVQAVALLLKLCCSEPGCGIPVERARLSVTEWSVLKHLAKIGIAHLAADKVTFISLSRARGRICLLYWYVSLYNGDPNTAMVLPNFFV
jgi:hypothetical protein